MKAVKYFMFALFAVVILVAAAGVFLPSSTQVSRTVSIEQSPSVIFDYLIDYKNFHTWSPWVEKDPNMKVEFTGPEKGVGTAMSWYSDNPNVGQGSQKIIAVNENKNITIDLDFGAMGFAKAYFELEPINGGVNVTWGFTTEHGGNLMSRYMGLMMDKWVGLDYEHGLTKLKGVLEALPKTTPANAAEIGSTNTALNVQTQTISYQVGDTVLTGFVAWPEGKKNIPGVLVVHEWWGHNDYARKRATMLAEQGYAAFALDMYGDGKVTDHPKEANAFMMEAVANAEVMQARFNKALEEFKKIDTVNPNKIAAIGYCFGGAVVLSMARMGVELSGVASFHGGLGKLAPLSEGGKKVPYLVLNGADDPMVTAEDKQRFKQQMDEAKVTYEFVDYPGAVHAFTNPGATEKGLEYGLPLAYNAEADEDSWQRLTQFLKNAFQ